MSYLTMTLFMSYMEGLTLQYIAVAIIVLISLIIVVRKIVRISRHRTGNSICSGCALADNCTRKDFRDCPDNPDTRDPDSGSCPDCH